MKSFKSGKQRRAEMRAARQRRQTRLASRETLAASPPPWRPTACVMVDPSRLQPNNSYSVADFMARGYYRDIAFRCIDCGAEGVWTAERQRWWYEVAGGDIFTTARRCAHCRAVERQRKAAARGTVRWPAGCVSWPRWRPVIEAEHLIEARYHQSERAIRNRKEK